MFLFVYLFVCLPYVACLQHSKAHLKSIIINVLINKIDIANYLAMYSVAGYLLCHIVACMTLFTFNTEVWKISIRYGQSEADTHG